MSQSDKESVAASAGGGAGEELSFEQSLDRLEKVVQQIETHEMSLDELLKHYVQGMELARICQKKLAEAEAKVLQVEESLAGELTTAPADLPEEEP